MANSILYSEINAVCVLILILLSVKVKNSMFIQEQRILFLKVAVSNSLFFALDAVWIFADNNALDITVAVNWIINIAYYILSGILGYYWFMYSETIQDSQLVREKKYRVISMLPMVILIILTICSIKTGWLFYIDANNMYHRGSAYVLQLITSYGYIVFTALKAFCRSLKIEDYRKKSDYKTLATFILPTLVAGILQVLCPGFPMLCIGNTIGILYIYLTLQEQLVSLDALTKLNNRNQLFQYMSTKLMHPREDKDLYLLIMDVDYFKSINDEYGHIEGDKALKLVANSLMKACHNRNYFVARYGGDEFVALCEIEPQDSILMVCNNIRQNLREIDKPYELSVSIGYTKYTPDIRTQQEFIDRADKELYKIKKSRV